MSSVKKAKGTSSLLSHSFPGIFADPFFNTINELEKPDSNKLETLEKINKSVAETKVITKLKQCEQLKPLVEFGLNSGVKEEREKVFLALKGILESVCDVKLADADTAPDDSVSINIFINLAISYMRENKEPENAFVLTIGLVILESAVKVCEDTEKIKEITAVEVESEDVFIRSRKLSLFGTVIDKYHSDSQAYKKRSKESEIAALKRSTSNLNMSAAASSSSLSSSTSSLPLDHQDLDTKSQRSNRPSINNYFSNEMESSTEKGAIDVTNGKYGESFLRKMADQNKDLLKAPNDFALYFYERYIIFVLKDNIDADISDITEPVLKASLEKRNFAIKFLAEYIVFNKEDKAKAKDANKDKDKGKEKEKDPLERCKKALKDAIKHTKDLSALSDFFSFYSENFYKSNSKWIDDFIILAIDLMNADCTNERLQEQSFTVLESIPATRGNIGKVGTENTVKFIVDTMLVYKNNEIICQKGAGILYKLLSIDDSKVNKSIHKKSTYSAIMTGIRNDHEPTKVICYRTLDLTLSQDKLKGHVADAIKKECEQIENDVENPKLRRYVIPVVLHSGLTKKLFPKIKELVLSNDSSQTLSRSSCLSLLNFFSESEPTPEIFDFAKRAMEMLDGDWEVQEVGCTVVANNITEDNFSEGLKVIIDTVKRYYPENKEVLAAGYNAILSVSKKSEKNEEAILAAINDPSEMEVMPIDDQDWRHPPRDLLTADSGYTIAEFYFKLLSSSKNTAKDPSENLKLVTEIIAKDKCPAMTVINGVTALNNIIKLNHIKDTKLLKKIIEGIVHIMEQEKDYSVRENQLMQCECCKFVITYAKKYRLDIDLIYNTIEALKGRRDRGVNEYYDKVSDAIKAYTKASKKSKRSTVMVKEMQNSYWGETIDDDNDNDNDKGPYNFKHDNGEIPCDAEFPSGADDLETPVMDGEKERRPKRIDFEETFSDMTPDEMNKTLEEGLKEAEFIEVPSMLKYSKEVADDLKKKGLLKRGNGNELTISESMAISIYTFDNGRDNYEENPFRVLNKSIVECNSDRVRKLRVYMLYLLKALRKLEPYSSTGKLYRSILYPPGRVYRVGERFLWHAFTSTTKDKDIAMDFINSLKDDSDVILFEIDGDVNGYNIRDFSFHPSEDEIILELDTLVEVTKIETDPQIPKLTHISVTTKRRSGLQIAEKVNEFTGKCVYNVEKQSPPSFPEIRGMLPVPISEYDEQKTVEAISTMNERYRDLKKCLARLMYGTERAMLKSLKDLIDEISYDDTSIVKFNQLTQEESCAVYMSTYWTKKKTGERVCPTEAVNDALCAKGKFIPEKVLYIMHVLNGLRKVPSFSNDGNPFYVCVPKGWEPTEGEAYVIPGFSIVYTSKEEALKVARAQSKEYTSVLEFSGDNLRIYNVAQLSNGLKSFKMIMEPNFRFRVSSVGDKETISVEPIDTQDENNFAKTLSAELNEFEKKIQLPPGWTVAVDDKTGKLYYTNEETCQTQWVRPDVEDPFYYENAQWKKSVLIKGPLNPLITAGSRSNVTVKPAPKQQIPMQEKMICPQDEIPLGVSATDEITFGGNAVPEISNDLNRSCNVCPQNTPNMNPPPYTPNLNTQSQITQGIPTNLNQSCNIYPQSTPNMNPPPYTPNLNMPPQITQGIPTNLSQSCNGCPQGIPRGNPPPYTPNLNMPPQITQGIPTNLSQSCNIYPQSTPNMNPPPYTPSSNMPQMANLGQSMNMQNSYTIQSRFPGPQGLCQTYPSPQPQWQQSQSNCPPYQSFNGQPGGQIWRN